MKCHLCQWECEQCGGTTSCTIWLAVKGRDAELARLRAELASVKAVCQRAADWLRSHRDCAEGDAATVCELVAAAKEGEST